MGHSYGMELRSGDEQFTLEDLCELSGLVAAAWTEAAELDWTAQAGTLDWSCMTTADHAVDCVYAPAFFLASRQLDGYPDTGLGHTIGPGANPARLIESLRIATRILAAVVKDTGSEERAVIFRRPVVLTAERQDFPPRAAVELILHAHDVCTGLKVPFEPPTGLCYRLREHTRTWPMWTMAWSALDRSGNSWRDLLRASGRELPAQAG